MSSSQVPLFPGNDRTRTNWTPAMERFFIDLMLDQMHRGNRMGHTFNKQAWIDMLNMFNAKFGTKYDRDVLKSHYTNLWKQYNEVKNLLEQNGFSWDDSRKMVVASDDVWDSFIKAHPDSHCYKKKSLMNFNDLCLIYAYTVADGRYSRSSHDVDLDDDAQGLNIGNVTPTSTEHVKKDWTVAMDRYFIELMLDQLKQGNRRDMTFNKQAWKHMLTFFNENFCSQYSISLLKLRYKKLFKYYNDIRSILERRGFSWDDRQQMISADDAVWEKCIKEYPDAQSYRMKVLLNYQDLSLIYGNQVINRCQDHLHHDKNFEDGTNKVKTAEEKNICPSAQSNGLGPSWTPAMDRFFIDLLQEQALRGNKIGHEFTAEAWTEMTGLFTNSFGSHHDKRFLKNRYKNLRRQYNGINFLLDQNGFSWDENREMVAAEDYAWNSIIKVHPDAHSYKDRSVPSYHKLCVIFGEENSNGRSIHKAHDVELDGTNPTFIVRDNVRCHENGDCSRTEWTPSMARYFIDILLNQVIRGKQIDHRSDDQAWIDMALLFKEKSELNIDKDSLMGYHKHLWDIFNDMKNLLGQNRFSWDETQQLVAAHDNVWNAYAKENPDVRSYRTESMPNYNDLFLIYGDLKSDYEANGPAAVFGMKHQSSYCLRTDWTPPMDRFFIDLMLKHVREGSMVNLRFNKQAWSDMDEKFKAEFGSQQDKEVLKSHFVNLRKRFNDMKNLIDMEGFAWDELKQKIIAEEDLWNSYMKEYPDALSYRNKTLPNYNDMFLIFGDTNSDGGQDHSSQPMAGNDRILEHDVADDDGLGLFDYDPPQIIWTKSMEVYFIELLVEHVLKGNKIGQTFNEKAWTSVIALFNEKFGLVCDKDDVESWYSCLKEEYQNITDLLNQKGFAWDVIGQRVMADDQDWRSYFKEHPGAIKYKDRIISSYNDLCLIFGNDMPPRRSRHSVANMEVDNNTRDMGLDGILGDALYQSGEFETQDHKKKRKSRASSTSVFPGKVSRQKMEDSEALGRESCMTKTIRSIEEKERMSIEVIVSALQAIPDMDDELFLEACQLLEDEKKAKVFVAMDVNQRKKWLHRKLHR